MNMVLRLLCYHFHRHSAENCAPESFNLHTLASKTIRFGRVNNSGKAHSTKMFKLKSKHYIYQEPIAQRLPRLLKIPIHTHEQDSVHQTPGLFCVIFNLIYTHSTKTLLISVPSLGI